MSGVSRDELTVASAYVAPRSTMEGRLAELWSRKLGVSPIIADLVDATPMDELEADVR